MAFTEALKLGVNRAEVVVPLANALIGQARLQEVVSNAKFATTGLPPGIKAQLLLVQATAHSDLSAGPVEALKAIEEARAIDPKSPDSFVAEIPIRIRSRQFKEALAAADRALALAPAQGPAQAEVHYLRGSTVHAQGDATAALAAYDKALAINPAHVESLIARAGLRLDQNRLDDVQKDVSEVRRLSPRDPRARYLAGVVADRKGDRKSSRASMSEVTALLDPIPVNFFRYRPQLLILGGLSHYGLGQNEKARPYLELVTRLHPESPVAKLLGTIYLSAKDTDRAIETLEGYLKFTPGDQHATVLLASALYAKGRHLRAAQLLQDAIKRSDTPQMQTFLGLALVGGGKRMDALGHLETAYRKDPSQVTAGAALVSLYFDTKQAAKAQAIAESLVARSPKEAQYQLLLGMARLQAGDSTKARQAYEQAVRLDPNFTPAQISLARLDLQLGQLEAAGTRLSNILAKDEKNIEALIEIHRVAERRGLIPDATRLLEKAADHSTGNELRPALLLVDFYLRNGQPDAAAGAVKRLNAKAPDSLPVLMANARVALAKKDYPGAQQILTRASRTAEFDPQFQVQVALQQLAAQDAKGALYSLTKAQQGRPDFLPAKAMLVDVNLRLGDLPGADAAARAVLASNPALAVGHALCGDVAMARGQTTPAVECYKKAHQIEASPISLGRLYRATERQNPAAAAQLAEKWLSAHPRDQDVRRMLADGYARSGNFAAARIAYEALVAVSPDDADALNNLANVLILAKDPTALKVAERALARKPEAAYILSI